MSIELNGSTGIDFNDGSNQSTAATPYGRKNLIINGDMRIAQRGTSTSGVTSDGYHSVDRMRFDVTNIGTWTHSQDTDVPTGQGFTHSLKLQCTTADASPAATDLLAHNFRLEGQMLQHLKYGTSSAETLTLSFWVKSNKTGTYVADLRHVDASLNYGKAYTINVADTWEKKTLTFEGNTSNALDNDNNQSLQVNFWLGAGSDYSSGTQNTTWSGVNADRAAALTVNLADSTSNYINITGCQLEIGDAASDFEFMPYDMELARCQRYYQIIHHKYRLNPLRMYASSTSSQYVDSQSFRVVMRDTPAATEIQAPTLGDNASGILSVRANTYGVGVAGTVSAVGSYSIDNFIYSYDAEL